MQGRWIGPACAVVGVVGFSFKAIFVKLAFRDSTVDVSTLLALRMIYSTPLLLLMAWYASRQSAAPRMTRGDWLRIAWFGFTAYYLASVFDFLGLRYISASLERLILFLYPTFVVLLSALLLGVRVTRRAAAALALSYAGIVVAFAHDVRFAGNPRETVVGSLLVLSCAVIYALYLVQSGALIARLGSLRFIAWAMLVSVAFVMLQFLIVHPVSALAVSPRVHALSFGMAVVSTVIPTWLIAESVRRIGANQSSLIGAMGPMITMAFGAVLLDEPIEALQVVGAALVLAGVLLVSLRPSRRSPLAEAAVPER
ncbi:MAG: DMT family transporter [Burkholderiales bacterium]